MTPSQENDNTVKSHITSNGKTPSVKRKRKKTAPKTFQSAFEVLKTNANNLQRQTEPDIDNLMTIVEESIQAYKVCQQRIDAVQKALDVAFADEMVTEKP